MSTMIRSQYSDLVLQNALPALEFIVEDEFQAHETKYDKIFNVKQMRTSIAQSTQVSSLQAAGAVGEAEEIPMQRVYQGYSKTYTAVKYGILLATSQELLDDMEFDVMGQNARKLTRAFMSTVESVSADVFNTGFSSNGPDGQTLFSTAHPLLAPGLANGSNRLAIAADLSSTMLKAMVTLLRKTVDTAGNKVMIPPKWLLVSPDNEFLAYELCKSAFLPNSDNSFVNSENSVRASYGIQPIVNDYLTSSIACFLLGDKPDHQLVYYWRKEPEIGTEYDFKTETALTKLSGRFAVGYSDWRGVVGTEGV